MRAVTARNASLERARALRSYSPAHYATQATITLELSRSLAAVLALIAHCVTNRKWANDALYGVYYTSRALPLSRRPYADGGLFSPTLYASSFFLSYIRDAAFTISSSTSSRAAMSSSRGSIRDIALTHKTRRCSGRRRCTYRPLDCPLSRSLYRAVAGAVSFSLASLSNTLRVVLGIVGGFFGEASHSLFNESFLSAQSTRGESGL